LVAKGLIQELKFGGGASRYDGRAEPRRCGKVFEFDVVLSQEQLGAVRDQTEWSISDYHIEVSGLCEACRRNRSRS